MSRNSTKELDLRNLDLNTWEQRNTFSPQLQHRVWSGLLHLKVKVIALPTVRRVNFFRPFFRKNTWKSEKEKKSWIIKLTTEPIQTSKVAQSDIHFTSLWCISLICLQDCCIYGNSSHVSCELTLAFVCLRCSNRCSLQNCDMYNMYTMYLMQSCRFVNFVLQFSKLKLLENFWMEIWGPKSKFFFYSG